MKAMKAMKATKALATKAMKAAKAPATKAMKTMKATKALATKAAKATKAMKAMKAMKSMKAKTEMKAMKRPSAKQAMQPAAVVKDRIAPMVPSFDEDHVEVAQMDANSGEVFCYVSMRRSDTLAELISEMEKPGCDGVRLVAVGICVTVMDDKTKEGDDGKKRR